MKNLTSKKNAAAVGCLAIAGLASAAIAGPAFDTFSLTMVQQDEVNDFTGPLTIMIDIFGDSSFGTHYIAANFGMTTDGHEDVSDIRWSPADWTYINSPGEYDGAGSFTGILTGQIVLFDIGFSSLPEEGSELGGLLGSFQIDFDEGLHSDLDLSFLSNLGGVTLQTVDVDLENRTAETEHDLNGELILNGLTISVPSPSAMALLGFGGLAATRRRR